MKPILIFGPQGVGKTTLSTMLSRKLDIEIKSSDKESFDSSNIKIGDYWNNVWKKFKETEIKTIIPYLIKYKNDNVILDIGGSHGVWEDEKLQEILKIIEDNQNRFLIIPYRDIKKSQSLLKERLLNRELESNLFVIQWWETILSNDNLKRKVFIETLDEYQKNYFLKYLECFNQDEPNIYKKMYKGNLNEAKNKYSILKMKYENGDKDLWLEFDINNKTKKYTPDPLKIEDYSIYFMKNMMESGISKHIIYLEDKSKEEVVDEMLNIILITDNKN